MKIGDALKKRRLYLGLTLEDVGNAVGVGKSTVKKWESGLISNMRRDRINELAKILRVSPLALVVNPDSEINYDEFCSSTESRDPSLPSNVHPIKLKRFPVLGEIACGTPIFASEDHETYIDASADIKADFCLVAKGDSMTGARINNGDVVFIREQPTVENGEIAAVIIGEEATLKRWYFYPEKKKLILNPENPAFEPLVYIGPELNEVRCLGKAVSFMSKL
jgi:repressor LexA